MFWDKISPLYDLFENVYNHRVYAGTGRKVAEFIDVTDVVLECACGTGAITVCIAGNVIHLLQDPGMALAELERVVKPGGRIIIPTYINMSKKSAGLAVKFVELLGADFKKQFDLKSYKSFFKDMGYDNVEYHVVDGRMPCAIAVIKK